MTRDIDPSIDPGTASSDWEEKAKSYRQREVAEYRCETITPLYGGGVSAGEVDRELPIRPSAIRGQLRFWWRLLNALQHANAEALFAAERAIWGGIGKQMPVASKVTVRVEDVSAPDINPAFTYVQENGKYKSTPQPAPGINTYALFPAQGSLEKGRYRIKEKPHQIAAEDIQFTLYIQTKTNLSPAQKTGVIEALRWWASFGGVGARTRRGVGAIKVRNLEPVTPEEVAAQRGQLALRGSHRVANSAWNEAVNCLNAFRQGRGIGRAPGKERPGRSHWPEPDSIRRLWGPKAHGHPPKHEVEGLYPRAAFGLPIVYHFGGGGEPSNPEPVLEPDGDVERMASPLILRPYWNGRAYQAAALLLPGWEKATDTRLKFKGTGHSGLETWPDDPALKASQAALINPMDGHGDDPLSAFLHFFQRGCN